MAHNAPSTTRQGQGPRHYTAQVVAVDKDIMEDGRHSYSCKVRVYGEQSDLMAIPDENLQQIRCARSPHDKMGSPLVLPGQQVRITDYGGTPGSTTMGPYITHVDSNRYNAPLSSPFLVASDVAQPTVESDQYPYDKYTQSKCPLKNNTTQASAAKDCWVQNVDQDPKEKAKIRKNPWGKSGANWD